jgi:cofilin
MGDLAVLRTAKQAMDESLITQEDFDVVKRAFLKAQQIKAGLDAGFIREEDYVQARDSFLHSLDFRVSSFSAPALVPAPTNAAVASGSSGRGAASIPKIGSQLGLTNGGHTQAPVHRSAAQLSNLSTITAPQPAAAAAPPAGPPLTARGSNDYSGSNGGAEHSGMPGTVPLPADLPRIGRAGTTAGKVRWMASFSVSTGWRGGQCDVMHGVQVLATWFWNALAVCRSQCQGLVSASSASTSSTT